MWFWGNTVMKIGILAERGSEVFCWKEIRKAMRAINADICYLTECPTNRRRRKLLKIPAQVIWRIVRMVENRKCGYSVEHFAPADSIMLDCNFRGHFKDFPDSEIKKLCDLELDLIIRLGGRGIYRGPILDVARHGLVSIHHGDHTVYRGGPPGFWEILNGETGCGFIVQKLTKVLDGGMVLASGSVAIEKYAALNRKNLYHAADKATAEIVAHIDRHGQLPPVEKNADKLGRIYLMPDMIALFKYFKILLFGFRKSTA